MNKYYSLYPKIFRIRDSNTARYKGENASLLLNNLFKPKSNNAR